MSQELTLENAQPLQVSLPSNLSRDPPVGASHGNEIDGERVDFSAVYRRVSSQRRDAVMQIVTADSQESADPTCADPSSPDRPLKVTYSLAHQGMGDAAAVPIQWLRSRRSLRSFSHRRYSEVLRFLSETTVSAALRR